MQPYELDEDYMSPEEWRESVALFRPGDWSSERYQDVLQAMRTKAIGRRMAANRVAAAAETTLPGNPRARQLQQRLLLDRPLELRVRRVEPSRLFSPAEYVLGATAILGAFLVARWAARRYRAHHQAPAQPRALGLDVVIGAAA